MQELDEILKKIERYIEIYQMPPLGREVEGTVELLKECRNVIRKHMNDGWIPVEEQLPENAKHKGAFCPKYQVETKYGVTEGWYNPDVKSWYCLFWFMTQRYLEHEIDFVKGDVPKVVRVPLESDIVIAWRPLPESYRPERNRE